jgi:hypothetical protein
MDPIEKLSDEQLRVLSADLQVQLERGTGTRPVLWLLSQTRLKAAKAIVMFMDVDPDDGKLIRRLQAEVKLYDEMIQSCRALFARGKEADRSIQESDREALEEITSEMTDEERRLNNIETRGQD